MCRSVPQIDAVRTCTNTSAGPIDGTGAFSNESPRAGCILRKAFIVDGMEKRLLEGAIAMLAHRRRKGAARPPAVGGLRPSLARSRCATQIMARQRPTFLRSAFP